MGAMTAPCSPCDTHRPRRIQVNGVCELKYKETGNKEVAHSKGLDRFNSEASGLKSSQNRQRVQVRDRQGDSRVFFAVTESGIPTPKPCFLLQEAPVRLTTGLCCTLVLGGPHAKELCCETAVP